MPSRKEIQWSQLRVGALVLMGTAVLIGLIFLMSGTSGGIFSKKLLLRAYFQNAAGLKVGAPVTLDGVTIGNVKRMRVVPSRNPDPVEVTMSVGREYRDNLHTDSTASIAQAGVLGDSYVDLNSTAASGPPPAEDAELPAAGSPSIQDVIRTSEESIKEVQSLTRKVEVTVDSINGRRGVAGEMINDPALAARISHIATNLETITTDISEGKGSLGKMINDDTLYTHANSAVAKLDSITTALSQGQGTAGKLLHDDTLYKNLNSAVANTNQLVSQINEGHGALGKLAHDPEFAKKLDSTVTNLDAILNKVNQGQGTIGQLLENRALYDHADQVLDETNQLVKSIRQDPRKYLVIRLKMF